MPILKPERPPMHLPSRAVAKLFGASTIALCMFGLSIYGASGGGSGAAPQPAAAQSAPASEPAQISKRSDWITPDIDGLPDDAWGRAVRYGRDLVGKTASLIGPEVTDAAHRFAGNNLNCQSCHVSDGTKQFGLPFQGVYSDFPNYRARSGRVGTIEDRIQGCMMRSMNGKPLPLDSREMTALVAYLKFLSTGQPAGTPTPGRGAGRMPELARAADPQRGRTIYAAGCAACHGDDGQGQRVGHVGDAQGYTIPPLWGPDSFNDGAGMGRLINAANFIHSNMPDGMTWQQPVFSAEDAWDVAAFVEMQPRPHKAGLDKDFPNRLEKPVDAPYGPYADKFDEKQHKFGPFAAIRDALKTLKTDDSKHALPSDAPAQ
jgi:thiosulfate dehydrogenase